MTSIASSMMILRRERRNQKSGLCSLNPLMVLRKSKKAARLKRSTRLLQLLRTAPLRRDQTQKRDKFKAFCRTLDLSETSRRKEKSKFLLNLPNLGRKFARLLQIAMKLLSI